MKFSIFESKMHELGIITLAEISRALNTTPQAVSNWKSRDQVPYHIVAKINLIDNQSINDNTNEKIHTNLSNNKIIIKNDDESITISDILLTISEQLKVVILIPIITLFFAFTYTQFIEKPIFESHSTILLPENNSATAPLIGLASQFGANISQQSEIDLSSPSLFPELIRSRTFTERILTKSFYTELYKKDLPLYSIFTHGLDQPKFGTDTLIQQSVSKLQSLVSFETNGPFSILSVKANEPRFAYELNQTILSELQTLNRYFKSLNVNDKINFINQRINSVIGIRYRDFPKLIQSLMILKNQSKL